eukprot:6180689-Pleurochrysis_carterae.AAC.4
MLGIGISRVHCGGAQVSRVVPLADGTEASTLSTSREMATKDGSNYELQVDVPSELSAQEHNQTAAYS